MVLYLYFCYTIMHLCLYIGGRKGVFTGNFKALCIKRKKKKRKIDKKPVVVGGR